MTLLVKIEEGLEESAVFKEAQPSIYDRRSIRREVLATTFITLKCIESFNLKQ